MKIFITLCLVFLAFACRAQPNELDSPAAKLIIAHAQKTDEYKAEFNKMAKLKRNIELAEGGKLSKSNVVSQYNKEYGAVMGHYNSFDKVATRVKTGGDEFVRYRLMKICARIASEMEASQMQAN
jgi:hypothetical protein